jgi:undecaprenyl-diphosphatase
LTLPKKSRLWLAAAMVAHLGDSALIYPVLLLLTGWSIYSKRWLGLALAVALFLVIFLAATLTIALKYTLRRQRPNAPTGFASLRHDRYSFPSGHAVRMGSLAGAIAALSPTWGAVFALLALAVSLSRVLVGVHYLGDVAVGVVLGAGLGWVAMGGLVGVV